MLEYGFLSENIKHMYIPPRKDTSKYEILSCITDAVQLQTLHKMSRITRSTEKFARI